MNFWNSLPLFRLILPFILGIVFSNELYFKEVFALSICLFLGAALLHYFSKRYAFRWWFGVIMSCLMFCLGLWAVPHSLDKNKPNYFITYLNESSVLMLELDEVPKKGTHSTRAIAKVISVDGKKTTGRLMVYFRDFTDSLNYGFRLLTTVQPQKITPAKNPKQFNYQSYLANHQIYHQIYVSNNESIVIDDGGGNDLFKLVNKSRLKLSEVLSNGDFNSQQLAVCSSLLLGDKSSMDHELQQSFVKAGVMHVLAVSGLHVGILFLVVSRLLYFMDTTKWLKLFKLLIVISVLWFYAFITSLSPSVMRATTMFSFFALGHFLGRSTNVFNTLAASAFLLLILNPLMIFKMGFQLSYLAVLGIVLIFPKIYSLLVFKSKLVDSIWQLICVSISAQAATFSLSIFYFHQFPNYFLLANVLVLPFIPLIINFGLALFVFDMAPFIREPIILFLKFIVDILIKIIDFVQAIPNSIIGLLYIHWYEVIIIYALLGFVLLAVYLNSIRYVVYALFLVIALQWFHWIDLKKQVANQQIIFYSINKHTAFGAVNGKTGTFFMDNILKYDLKKQAFYVNNHWSYLDLDQRHLINLDSAFQSEICWKKNHHVQLFDQRLLWVNEGFNLMESNIAIELDYCLLSSYIPLDILLKSYHPKLIILDGALTYYDEQRLEKELNDEGIQWHHLKKDGALVVYLNHH